MLRSKEKQAFIFNYRKGELENVKTWLSAHMQNRILITVRNLLKCGDS